MKEERIKKNSKKKLAHALNKILYTIIIIIFLFQQPYLSAPIADLFIYLFIYSSCV